MTKETIIIDMTQIQVGDDGNTSHYGGYYTIKGTIRGEVVDKEYHGYGNDRGDNHYDGVVDQLINLGVVIISGYDDLCVELSIERKYCLYLDNGVLIDHKEIIEEKTEIVISFPENISEENIAGLMSAIIAQCDEDGEDYKLKTACSVTINGEVWR